MRYITCNLFREGDVALLFDLGLLKLVFVHSLHVGILLSLVAMFVQIGFELLFVHLSLFLDQVISEKLHLLFTFIFFWVHSSEEENSVTILQDWGVIFLDLSVESVGFDLLQKNGIQELIVVIKVINSKSSEDHFVLSKFFIDKALHHMDK